MNHSVVEKIVDAWKIYAAMGNGSPNSVTLSFKNYHMLVEEAKSKVFGVNFDKRGEVRICGMLVHTGTNVADDEVVIGSIIKI